MEHPEDARWHLDKKISVADIVAIVTSAVLVMTAYSTLNTRLTVVEARQDNQAKQRQEDMASIRSDIEYIRRGIDQLAAHAHRTDQMVR